MEHVVSLVPSVDLEGRKETKRVCSSGGKRLGIRWVFGWYLQVFAVLSWVFGVFGSFLGLGFPIFHVCESGGEVPFYNIKRGN